MNVVAFRIPYQIMGRKAYINGAASSSRTYKKGATVIVFEQRNPSTASSFAEVIGTCVTQKTPDDFDWALYDEEG